MVNLVDIQAYSKELTLIWKHEQGNRKFIIGGYSLGFRVAYHMALHIDCQIEKIINIDGVLYKNELDEAQITKDFIDAEKYKLANNFKIEETNLNEAINLKKWFFNDYFIKNVNLEIQHYIGKESLMKKYIPKYVSSNYKVYTLEGNHDNILEIESNLEFIVSKII